jgi:hypothetical protein
MNRQKRKRNLANIERLTEPLKFLLAVRYYTANLAPGEWTKIGPPRRPGSRSLPPSWMKYLKAVRRLLQIAARKNDDGSYSYRMPTNYRTMLLASAGLDLFDVYTQAGFNQLSKEFRLSDQWLTTFAEEHPHLLERAKTSLIEFYLPNRRPLEGGYAFQNAAMPKPTETLKPDISTRKPPTPGQMLQQSAKNFIARRIADAE